MTQQNIRAWFFCACDLEPEKFNAWFNDLVLWIVVLVRFWHAVNGLYIWEFLTTLDYEFAVIRGRRPYRWSIWVYSLARVAGLMSVILNFVSWDVTVPINCQLWISFQLLSGYMSSAAGSLLIVLRIVAIWNRNRFAVATAFGVWGISAAFFIQSEALLLPRIADNLDLDTNAPGLILPAGPCCVGTRTSEMREYRHRDQRSHSHFDARYRRFLASTDARWLTSFGDGFLLSWFFRLIEMVSFRKGLIWLLIATIAEAVPVIFIA
ncbi:hypothetical protein BC826DRAFT_1113452 [Russula brevipes]|nr:hypothetical protein BC826DRAFT_1113452 [Russula brevipes]